MAGLLMLSRHKGERIRVGKDIWIIVGDIIHGKVRIGIDAPRDLKVFREELLPEEEHYERIHQPGSRVVPSDTKHYSPTRPTTTDTGGTVHNSEPVSTSANGTEHSGGGV